MSEQSISTTLRTLADTHRRSHSVNPAILREAADEIDRLRGEIGKVAGMDAQANGLRERIAELQQRNARLLSKIQESEAREIEGEA